MTIEETKVYKKAWELHEGNLGPAMRHFRSTQRFMHLPDFGFSGRTFTNTSRMPKPRLVAAGYLQGVSDPARWIRVGSEPRSVSAKRHNGKKVKRKSREIRPKLHRLTIVEPHIARIYISPGHNFYGRYGLAAGDHPTVSLHEIECVARKGLIGDRFFDFRDHYKGQITSSPEI